MDIEQGECVNCHQFVSRVAGSGQWMHGEYPLFYFGAVGCRSYSFDPDTGWDDSLDRQWKAKPIPETVDVVVVV